MGGDPADGGRPDTGAQPDPGTWTAPGATQPQQWPQQPAPTGQWGYPYPAAPRTNGMAIAALVCGIANFACGITWIPALILGYMGRREIDQSGGTQTGREMAIAGIVLGYIGLGLTVLALLFFAVALAGLITVGSVGSGAPR